MASDWNAYLERLLAAKLTVAEYRLALALGRLVLGYRCTERALGEGLIRETADLDGRTFTRARAGLIARGLIVYEPGKRGRGRRSIYRLTFSEKPAVERVLEGEEKPAVERGITKPLKTRSQCREKPAVERGRIGSKGKEQGNGNSQALVAAVVLAYLGGGGNLERDGWRAMLAKHAAALAREGIEESTIIAAAGVLGREREFPGNLIKTARRIIAEGMPCQWREKRQGLEIRFLEECGCPGCLERVSFLREKGLERL